MTAIRSIAGAAIGVAVCYMFGAAVAWDANPSHWSYGLRLWCACWAIPWGIFGAIFADEAQY